MVIRINNVFTISYRYYVRYYSNKYMRAYMCIFLPIKNNLINIISKVLLSYLYHPYKTVRLSAEMEVV